MLAQWIEEVEEPMLDHDEEIGNMVNDLTGERPEPMRAAERLREINLIHQGRCGIDPRRYEMRLMMMTLASAVIAHLHKCLMILMGMAVVMAVEMVVAIVRYHPT